MVTNISIEITVEEALVYSKLRYRDLVKKLNKLTGSYSIMTYDSKIIEKARLLIEDIELENNKIQAYASALIELDRASLNSS